MRRFRGRKEKAEGEGTSVEGLNGDSVAQMGVWQTKDNVVVAPSDHSTTKFSGSGGWPLTAARTP